MKRSSLRPRLAALLIALCSCIGLLSLSVAPAWAAGTVTTFPVASPPYFITAGPNGNLWFTLHDRDSVDQMTTSGRLLSGFTYPASGLEGITVGPDGNIWFTELGGSKIGRFVAS